MLIWGCVCLQTKPKVLSHAFPRVPNQVGSKHVNFLFSTFLGVTRSISGWRLWHPSIYSWLFVVCYKPYHWPRFFSLSNLSKDYHLLTGPLYDEKLPIFPIDSLKVEYKQEKRNILQQIYKVEPPDIYNITKVIATKKTHQVRNQFSKRAQNHLLVKVLQLKTWLIWMFRASNWLNWSWKLQISPKLDRL